MTGATGATGIAGATGSKGSTGPTGPAGSDPIGGHEAIFGSERLVLSGECLGNVANMSYASVCPNTAGRDFLFTEGPVSAGGGLISDLQAEAATAPLAKTSSAVNVIDETPSGQQTVVMTCTVAAGATSCSNIGTVSIAAGHYVMVQVNTTAFPTTWRVSFRY
ncbi:MAG TPA: hypothetical protein VEJ23_05510 [Solirubrobacteraceae bacterium]|nr:hypothetical protein [Solirubrobacteraceae bacterium]